MKCFLYCSVFRKHHRFETLELDESWLAHLLIEVKLIMNALMV